MKKIQVLIFGLLTLMLVAACDDDAVEPNGVRGEWQWVRSQGGFGGWTLTPDSLGEKSLIIDGTTYSTYEESELTFQSEYEIKPLMDSTFAGDFTLVFESGFSLGAVLDGDELQLIEPCFDCYSHSYVRN